MIKKIFGDYCRSSSIKTLTQFSKKKPNLQSSKQKIGHHEEDCIDIRAGFVEVEKNKDENAAQ